MNLVIATLVAGILLLLTGVSIYTYPEPIRRLLTAFPRSRPAALVLLAVAVAFVLFHVSQLGEADFGKYKNLLFGFFVILAVGSWFRVPDFLGIRALSVLGLLLSGQFLTAAYLQPPTTRLFLVVLSYLIILLCLYLAASPFRFRDAVAKLNDSNGLRKVAGGALAIYGIALCLVPLTYGNS
jgi:hypothetical protein